jgi:hypothetical protein
MRRKNDILWKVVLEEVFDDLLRFLYEDADLEYNMDQGFQFLDKELAELCPDPEKDTDTRFADKLVKVFHRDGGEEWILLHIEIQGDTTERAEFSARMFRYFYRILDRFRRPVSAVAIFTGLDGKKMPNQFEYTYRGTRLFYQYHSFSILDFPDEELADSDNPFALVVLAAKTALLERKIPKQELLNRKVSIAGKLLRRGFQSRKVRAILKFLENCVRLEDEEMNRIFRERIQSQDKNFVMGIDEYVKMEGIEEGIEIRNRQFVENLLRETEFSTEKISALADVTVEFVNEVRNGLKDRATGE